MALKHQIRVRLDVHGIRRIHVNRQVDFSRLKGDASGASFRDNPHCDGRRLCRPIKIVVKPLQRPVVVGNPFFELKRACAHRVLAVALSGLGNSLFREDLHACVVYDI